MFVYDFALFYDNLLIEMLRNLKIRQFEDLKMDISLHFHIFKSTHFQIIIFRQTQFQV